MDFVAPPASASPDAAGRLGALPDLSGERLSRSIWDEEVGPVGICR